ncbi:MAG: CPBP family intramembrane metalloprotease [Dehalococcoidia bacterium]|jgi:uncharacterized protein|nr:CPBP family intramembrane metalloprotease [Dehalococcoidia bacterium]
MRCISWRSRPPPARRFPLRDELTVLGLRVDTRLTVVVTATTMLLLFEEYRQLFSADTFGTSLRAGAADHVLLYFVIPAALVVLVLRDSLRDYGFRLGDWRAGLRWAAGVLLVMSPILFFAAQTPEIQEYYSRTERSVLDVILVSGIDLIGWEFMFRGFLFFGLYRAIGPSAVLIQAVPFAMAHIGKPELESMTTFVGGVGFGWIAWRTDSWYYPFLIHWMLNIFVRLVAMSA